MYSDLIGNLVTVRAVGTLMPGGLAKIAGVSPNGKRILVRMLDGGGLRDIPQSEIV
jgi:hypothetical protein